MQVKARNLFVRVSVSLSPALSLFVYPTFQALVYISPKKEHMQLKVRISFVCAFLSLSLCVSPTFQALVYKSPKREHMQFKVRILCVSVSLTLSISLCVSPMFRALPYKSPKREHVQLKVRISCVCVCLCCSDMNSSTHYPIFSQKNPISPAKEPQNSRSCSTCLVRVIVFF